MKPRERFASSPIVSRPPIAYGPPARVWTAVTGEVIDGCVAAGV